MKIKYLGPGEFVNVVPYGRHAKDETKEYSDDFGTDLLATSKKQQFEEAEPGSAPGAGEGGGGGDSYEEMTKKEIMEKIGAFQATDELEKMKLKKADLIEILKKHEAQAADKAKNPEGSEDTGGADPGSAPGTGE